MPPTDQNFDPAIQTEKIGFDREDLIQCPKCGKSNGPDRTKCLYCAASLGIAPAKGVKLHYRKLEAWEKGWNVALRGASAFFDIGMAASSLGVDAGDLRDSLNTGVAMPVARVVDEQEGRAILAAIGSEGGDQELVSDRALDGTRPPIRLSGMRFDDRRIGCVDFNTGNTAWIGPDDLCLIVTGTLLTGTTEKVEKRKRGKDAKLLDEAATTVDEAVVDIYSTGDATGYRIHTAGFDFSCLGPEKGLVASENMRRLVARLLATAKGARLVDGFDRVAGRLEDVWPAETHKDHQGLVRTGIGKREFGVTQRTNNVAAFTRFSRLQWYMR